MAKERERVFRDPGNGPPTSPVKTQQSFMNRGVHRRPVDSDTYTFRQSVPKLIHFDELRMTFNSGSDMFCTFVLIKILYM